MSIRSRSSGISRPVSILPIFDSEHRTLRARSYRVIPSCPRAARIVRALCNCFVTGFSFVCRRLMQRASTLCKMFTQQRSSHSQMTFLMFFVKM
jgi:hypothetical protein